MGTPKKTALIVRGGWDGHQPVETTDSVVPFLRDNGYGVELSESNAVYADERLMATVDLIVQVDTMSTVGEGELAGLTAAVIGGTGFAGWHGGIADAYRNSPDYLQLVGGQFAYHPRKHLRPCSTTARTTSFLTQSTSSRRGRAIPSSQALQTSTYSPSSTGCFPTHTTTYSRRLRSPPGPPIRGNEPVTVPAMWTRNWGQGRIFVCTPGHLLEVLDDPNVRTIVERGMLWASR